MSQRFTVCFHCGVTNDADSARKDSLDPKVCFRCGTTLTADGKDPELKALLADKDAQVAKDQAERAATEAEDEANALDRATKSMSERAKELRSAVPAEKRRRRARSSEDRPNV